MNSTADETIEKAPFSGKEQLKWKLSPFPLRNVAGKIYSGLFKPEEYEIESDGRKRYLVVGHDPNESRFSYNQMLGEYKAHEWTSPLGHRIQFTSLTNRQRRKVASKLSD